MKLAVIAATAAAACAAALPAAATAPAVQVMHNEWSGTDTFTCGFPLAVDGSLDITTTTFFDSAGRAIGSRSLSRAEGSFEADNGRVVRYTQAMSSEVDLVTGTQSVSGVTTRLTAPGGGVLLNDVGRLVLQPGAPGSPPTVLFESGKHPTFEPGAWDVLCEYLAAP